jgi:hypothetical protein
MRTDRWRVVPITLALLALMTAGNGDTARSQGVPAPIEEVVLDNDSVRIVLVTYPPGADSDLHLNVGPEITIAQRGILALYTPQGREAVGSGVTAHWLPALSAHLARNESGDTVKFWSLLLKRCD